MKINFDVETYRARFLGGARSYLFFCIFAFPQGLKKDRAQDNLRSKLTAMGSSAVAGFGSGENMDVAGAATDAIGSTYDFAKGALSIFGLGDDDNLMSYLVKSANLPSSQFEERVIDWQGTPYKMASDRHFDDWTVAFNVDEKAKILQKFYDWQDMIQSPSSNVRSSAEDYMRKQEIHLIDYSGNTLKTYNLIGAWPKSVSQVALDYSTNEIARVEVTFSYQYHTITSPSDSFKADIIKRGAQKFMGNMSGWMPPKPW